VNWGELAVSGLVPTGTVTLLLADVEGSTRLWETQPEEMTAALARLNEVVCDVVAARGGVRPVEQGEGDSFVAAFPRASDAVAAALEVQRAPLAPIRLRIGLHTGEVQLRDEGNYEGPTINRAARLRDLAHGGQTVLSAATSELVVDGLPDETWLSDLGSHPLRDLPRPERVMQLCHPDLRNEFPPLRTPNSVAAPHLPAQLTSFVGRGNEMSELREIVADNRFVTLTGAGGVGKTRLTVQVAAQMTPEFNGGVWYVDLAPITDPEVVATTVARALGLPDQPGRSTMDTLTRFVADRHMLVVLDNCEHLLDACAALTVALLGSCAGLTLLATSREPIGVPGEVTWRVPSLSLDDGIELLVDRARRARPDFAVRDDTAAAVAEICARLDGIPLAIELAAARVRALSLAEILDGLRDRFRLLTGGARTAVRRQQTLRASVDWSHTLLTQPEHVLFRRLAVFLGGFDLAAAQVVGGGGDIERYQVLDLLSLLVDKSLVVANESKGQTRYRLLETVRQYALEKLDESGEADAVRTRHRDHYTEIAASLNTPSEPVQGRRLAQAEAEIDNLRAAFAWSRENSDAELALVLASSLQPLWLGRGRIQEGLAWLNAALNDPTTDHPTVADEVRARALADKAILDASLSGATDTDQAEQALAIARDVDDPTLLARALTAVGVGYDHEDAGPYFAEAIGFARATGDRSTLSQILAWQALRAAVAGDPVTARAAAEEGLAVAEETGDRFVSRACRWLLGCALVWQGDLVRALTIFGEVIAEAEAAHEVLWTVTSLWGRAFALAYRADASGARAAATTAIQTGRELGGWFEVFGRLALGFATLAAGDAEAAQDACDAAGPRLADTRGPAAGMHRAINANAALALGDLNAARRWAEEAVSEATGWNLMVALTSRARVAIAQGQPRQAERDARDALALGASMGAPLGISDVLECLADLAAAADSHHEAARLFGAADAARQRIGAVRFKIYETDYESSVAALRDAMGE